ncbi:hypothetical protein R3I93_004868 [Phoxinus phoxinus]|uniref:LIM zinc-binding domain-containing protein n=1 Tax=Phoxinus phoxinus TaxID=58324 RepID=A0AAN9HCL4_9TELE
MSFTGKPYSKVQIGTTSSTSKAVEDSKKKASLLKDNSWIRANVNEDKQVESDPNFGKTVLSRYKSNENLVGPQDKTSKTESKTTTVTTSPGSSVQALSKRFGGSQDKLNETRTTGAKTTVRTQPRTSVSTTINGSKITETTVTTTKQDVVKSFTKSETITDKDLAALKTKTSGDYKTEVITVKSSKDAVDGPSSPLKTTSSIKTYTREDVSPAKTSSYSVRSTKSSEDQLFDTLIPTAIKSSYTKSDSRPTSPLKTTSSIKTYTKEDVSPAKTTPYSTKSDYKTEVVTVKSSKDIIDVSTSPLKTTTSIKTYTEDVSPAKTSSYSLRSTKSSEDQLFDTLIPTSIKSSYTKSDSSHEDVSVSKTIRTVYSTNDRNEWSTVTSPSYNRSSFTESRPVDYISDSLTSKTSTTVYTSPERTVSARDICTYCQKNMFTDEKMILDDMNINCHARCFKCGVCNGSLGHLKAGDSLWVYRRAVYCESCFGVTRGKWIS